jgi:hypothetical protein
MDTVFTRPFVRRKERALRPLGVGTREARLHLYHATENVDDHLSISVDW